MSTPTMDWDDVRVFLAVVQAGSLATGARDAGVDRSTASRRIGALEKALGAALFLRARDGLRASPAGERLRAHAERMASEARALTDAARAEAADVRGVVKLATTEGLTVFLLRSGLLELCARHPALDVELLGGNRPVDLLRGEADLALRVTGMKEAALRVRRVSLLPFHCVAAESYVRRRGRPRSERDLAGHDAVVPSGELAGLPEARWLAGRAGLRVALRTNSMPALVTAVVEGAGVTAMPGPWDTLEQGMVRLFPIDAIAPRALYLASTAEASARAAVRVVAEHVAAICGRNGLARR